MVGAVRSLHRGLPSRRRQHHRQRGAAHDLARPARVKFVAPVDRRRLLITVRRTFTRRRGLSDRLGRKRVMQIGLFAFSVFSLLAAFSHNVSTLLTARALMGASAAFIFPATLSTLTVVFDDRRERAKAFGLWARRPVSPLPLSDRGWRSHHALFFRIDFLGERPDRSRGRRGDRVRGAGVHDPKRHPPDVVGLALGTAGITALILAIIQGPSWGGVRHRRWCSSEQRCCCSADSPITSWATKDRS